jgi:conjugal transfer pilus assembly protein TraB
MDTKGFKWSELSQGVRTAIVGGGVFFGVILAAQILTSKPAEQTNQQTPVQQTNLAMPNRQSITMEDLSAQLRNLSERVNRSEKMFEDVGEIKQMIYDTQQRLQQKETQWKADEIVAQIDLLKAQVDSLQREKAVLQAQQAVVNAAPADGAKPALDDSLPSTPAAPPPPPPLRVIGEKRPAKVEEKKPVDGFINDLLAGGMFEGILLTGMDAPTNTVAKNNPIPALIRVKTDAILPNMYQGPVRECFVVASGYGVLATERAVMRTEKISCVTEDGEGIEQKIDGYVVGEDGKAGLRGRLVSKQGQLIAKSLVAGLLEGLGKALQPAAVPQLQTNPRGTTQYQDPNLTGAGKSALYGGVSIAANNVAKFYLEMAKEIFPVVEVDAGRRVTVVLLNGIALGETKQEGAHQ